MNQTKKGSIFEAIISVLIGYIVALISQFLIFPHYGFDPPLSTNIAIGIWFTGVSLIRSYCVRRLAIKIKGVFS